MSFGGHPVAYPPWSLGGCCMAGVRLARALVTPVKNSGFIASFGRRIDCLKFKRFTHQDLKELKGCCLDFGIVGAWIVDLVLLCSICIFEPLFGVVNQIVDLNNAHFFERID